MAKSVAGIQDLLTKLKKDAGPWNKDTHEIVEKITAALGKLMPMSTPPESVTNQVVQLLRHFMSKLYDPFTTLSLQLAVATFGFIINEKIVRAVKAKSLKERMQWETIAEAVLDGVLDYLDLVDQKEKAVSTKAKEAVSQAFYTTICSIFFSADFAVPSQLFSVKLRALAYSILFSTCDGITKNIEKLRNSKVLGSERLGRVIAKTKDYVALEQLLDLLARLIPPTNNTAKGRASRKFFIEEVFIIGGSDAIPGDDIVKLLEFINSSEWEETSAKIVDILARDISFPQPFKVKAIEISDTTFKLRASDRFYVDRNSFLVNNWNEYEEEEAIKIQYSSLRQVKVNDTGAVQIMTSSPATIGDKEMAKLTDDQPVFINFIVGRTDIERFVSAIGARGLGRLVQQNGRTIKNPTARISTIPGQLAFSEEDKTLSQPLSFVEKVKVVKTRGEISERSDDNATFPNLLDGGAHDESHLPDTGPGTTAANGSRTSHTSAPAGRARGKTDDPSRDGRPDPAVAHDGLPDVPAPRTGHAPEPAQYNPAALPPVRARPAPRPAGRAARAAAPDPVRAAPNGLPSSPPWDAPNARTCSQKMHDAVFGTDDEELSDVSDRELEGRPRSALAGAARPDSRAAAASIAAPAAGIAAPVAIRAEDSVGHASRPRGDAAKTEGGAAKPKLDGAARLRGRRVVTQESVHGDEETVVLGTIGGGVKEKKKKRAAEESSEEELVELDSNAKGKAKAKAKAKKPPKKQSKVDAGEAAGKIKKSAAKARPKAKAEPSVPQRDPSSDGAPSEAAVDNRTGRNRPTRTSAVAASKRIARQASEESIPLDHGDIEQLEENVKAKATKKAPKADNAKDDGRSSKVHVPEAVSEDARASTPVQIAHVAEPVPVLVTPVPRFQGMKRKRGVDADAIPVSSSPYPESAEPQAKRKRPLPEVTPKAPTPPRPRKLNTAREKARPTKKYGKAAKTKYSSPVLSVVENVDYDEIPGETGSSARASSPVAKADSPPAKMAHSTGKSKVARMKAKDGSTPVAPEKGKGVSVKDVATSAAVAKKETKSTVRHVQEAEEDGASVVEISPSPVPSRKATASKKAVVKKTVKVDTGDQVSNARSVKKEPMSKSTKKPVQDVAQEIFITKSQTKLIEHWSSRKSNKAPRLEEQYAVKAEAGHQDERSSSDDVRAPTDEIQSSSESALPPPPSDIRPVEIPVFDDFDITLGFDAAEDGSTWEQNDKAERAVPHVAEKATMKATKKEAVTIDLTNDSPPPKPKPKPKSRPKPTAPPPREPSEQQEEPAPDVDRPHSAPLNDTEEADDPFAEMDNVYEDTYQDFTVPLNSSGRLLSPTDTSKATSSSDPVQVPQRPLPQATHSAKKNVTFASDVQEAEERKLAKEENTIADDSGIFWSNESSKPRSADRSAGIKRLEEKRTRKHEEHQAPQAAQTQLQMHPSPASPKIVRPSKAKKIAVRPEQAQPETKDTSIASQDPVTEITSIIDAISNVVKLKITDGFDGVSRSAREARRRILNQAMHELDEIGQTNAPTFNALVKLEETYGAYSRKSIAASNTAIEFLQQINDHLQKIVQEHDRAVQAHSKVMPKLKPFPKVTRWL